MIEHNIEVGVVTLDNIKDNTLNISDYSKVVLNIDKVFDLLDINLYDESELTININYDSEILNEILNINLIGYNSKVNLNINTITSTDEEFIININHLNKKTISNVINHGVVLNDSKLSFVVNTKVVKGSIKSILNQDSRIILLGENNSVIKPNMYIDEYDVDAYHSSVIGYFNKEDIFYLMSKGITYSESLKLLINGFLGGKYEGKRF